MLIQSANTGDLISALIPQATVKRVALSLFVPDTTVAIALSVYLLKTRRQGKGEEI